MIIDLLKTELAEIILNTKKIFHAADSNTKNNFGHVAMQELNENGFVIIKDFKNTEWIELVKSEIDEIILNNAKIWKDEEGADNRIYFANEGSGKIQEFLKDPDITDFVKIYENSENLVDFTLANKISAVKNNKGSGGGWHRDYFLRKQTKAIMYLTDTTSENGPFQYIKGSHRFGKIKNYIKKYKFRFNQYRYSDEQINQIINSESDALQTLTGNKGDLILVDTRGIHRGKPIEIGERYALTNYFWANKSTVPPHIQKLNPFI